MEIVGFIPCRAGSERVKNKNTRPFAGMAGGLLELKLRQLRSVRDLDKIIVSSNDPDVLQYAAQFSKEFDSRVEAMPRPEVYGLSSTSMESFIRDYIAHLQQNGHLFWTHVTHPFAGGDLYSNAIEEYRTALASGYDSMLSATKLHKFLWKNGSPFNYDNSAEKWPRSQDIEPVYDINHAIYAIPFEVMRKCGDRIGKRPFFLDVPEREAMDIDWEDQFLLMEEIALGRIARGDTLL